MAYLSKNCFIKAAHRSATAALQMECLVLEQLLDSARLLKCCGKAAALQLQASVASSGRSYMQANMQQT
jgi:hypothetical protein